MGPAPGGGADPRLAGVRLPRSAVLGLLVGALALSDLVSRVESQSGRLVKVVLEFKQQTQGSRQGAQGTGGVIVEERRGDVRARPRGGLAVEDTTTRVTRSTGLFTVVEDGGVGSLMVAQEVPYQQMAYYHDYATGRGYVVQGVAWASSWVLGSSASRLTQNSPWRMWNFSSLKMPSIARTQGP